MKFKQSIKNLVTNTWLHRFLSKILAYIKGLVTWFPGAEKFLPSHHYQFYSKPMGWASKPEYCYSVWLRHMVMLHKYNLPTEYETVVEIGPGDSLGVGHAALLMGSKKYIATDIIDRNWINSDIRKDIEKLIGQPIPVMDKIKPYLDDYSFPKFINRTNNNDVSFNKAIPDESVDLVISQATMEHVDDLEGTLKDMARMLKKGGVSSYQVDLKCHQSSSWWNGHLMYTPFEWKIIRGNLPYFINRATLSQHLSLHEKHGLKVVGVQPVINKPGVPRKAFAKEFKNIPEEDLLASSAYICAVKV